MNPLARSIGGPELEYPDAPEFDPKPLNALAVVNVLLRHRKLIVLLSLSLFFYTVGRSLMAARTYTSTALFIPSTPRATSALTGLAAQLGITAVQGDAAQSPQFYAEVIESREILLRVGRGSYALTDGQRRLVGNLAQLLDLGDISTRKVQHELVQELRSMVSTDVSNATGSVRLRVTSKWPALSEQIAQRVLQEVIAFNSERRRAKAAADREFTESQLSDAYARLRVAEREQQTFLINNREYRMSPTLSAEFDRISRTVAMRQDLYGALARAFEQAKMDEARDSPVLTVIETPNVPVVSDARGTVSRSIAALLAGFVVAGMIALVTDFFSRSGATTSSAAEEFRVLRTRALAELRAPWRLLKSA